jgi:hypothetical protein
VTDYESALGGVSAGTLALIERMEQDPGDLDEGQEFGMAMRQMAVTTRDSMGTLAEMVDGINANARLSRVLREPSARLTAALDRVANTTAVVDEWDRRLQSLGIPLPPEDWEPDFAEDEAKDLSKAHETPDEAGGDGSQANRHETPDEAGADESQANADDDEPGEGPA